MIRQLLSASILVVIAIASPASAQDQCVAPKAPVIPDGARASANQMGTAQNDLKTYATASDIYRDCLAKEVARQKDMAKQANQEFDSGIQTSLKAKSDAARQDAQRLATAWGSAVDAFTKAQQRRRPPPSSAGSAGGAYGSKMGGY